MRIAIATDWFTPRVGGIETQLEQLADGLGRRGHAVDVITSTRGARDGVHYRVRTLDVAKVPLLDLALSPGLFAALRRELARDYDVVHAHVSVVSPVGYVAAVVARTLDLPTVVTFHSVLLGKRYILAAANVLASIGRSGVIWSAVSPLVAAQARAALATDVVVLPNGIDVEAWTRRGAGARDRSPTPTLVGTMRLQRKKRPLELVRAFAAAAERTSASMRLVVVGVGPLEVSVRKTMRRLQADDARVQFELRGRMTPDGLRDLYGQSDGFVLASRRESFGIAALEARAAGLPVIAMRESGSTDFLQHEVNSLLCRDDQELSSAIARFVSDPALRARLSLPSALERFDWRTVLSHHESVYGRARLSTRAAPRAAAV